MAVITTRFDTKDKSLAVDIDGVAVENVVDVSHYRRMGGYDEPSDSDDFRCSVSTYSKDEESEICTVTRLCASESAEGKAVAAKGSTIPSPLPGFVVAKATNKVHDDIASFFGGK